MHTQAWSSLERVSCVSTCIQQSKEHQRRAQYCIEWKRHSRTGGGFGRKERVSLIFWRGGNPCHQTPVAALRNLGTDSRPVGSCPRFPGSPGRVFLPSTVTAKTGGNKYLLTYYKLLPQHSRYFGLQLNVLASSQTFVPMYHNQPCQLQNGPPLHKHMAATNDTSLIFCRLSSPPRPSPAAAAHYI